MCGERDSRKLEKDVRRAEETCGKKYNSNSKRGRSFRRRGGKIGMRSRWKRDTRREQRRCEVSGMNEAQGCREVVVNKG